MDRGNTPQQFITLFAGRSNADRQVVEMFASEFGANAAAAAYKLGTFENPVIPTLTQLVQAGKL